MVDVEACNAVIAMVMHLMSAFKTPARPRAPQVLALACAQQPPQPPVHARGRTPLIESAPACCTHEKKGCAGSAASIIICSVDCERLWKAHSSMREVWP